MSGSGEHADYKRLHRYAGWKLAHPIGRRVTGPWTGRRTDVLLTMMTEEPTYAEIQKLRQGMRRRLKQRPDSLSFWQLGMSDAESRNCRHCGRLFKPDLVRPCNNPGAPPSVVRYQQRAFCSSICASVGGYNTKDDGRAARIRHTQDGKMNRAEAFERDKWHCYLCGRPTVQGARTGDGRAATVDHIVPLVRNGTESEDNIRCACSRCNTEKGSQTIWNKLKLRIAPGIKEDVLKLLPSPLGLNDLVQLWRYYIFDGDHEQEWWNKPPHPLVTPIARTYPKPPQHK